MTGAVTLRARLSVHANSAMSETALDVERTSASIAPPRVENE
jgi:hypothetical protein